MPVEFDVQSDAHQVFVASEHNAAVPFVVFRFRALVSEHVRARRRRMAGRRQAGRQPENNQHSADRQLQ